METEKRIGDFRVNRKVSWGITFPQNLHTAGSVRKPPFAGLCASFVHSPAVEICTLCPHPPDAVRQPRHRPGILVANPPIAFGPPPAGRTRGVGADTALF